MAFAKGIAAGCVLFCAHKRVPEKRQQMHFAAATLPVKKEN